MTNSLGIFGGTFNPPHLGHSRMAKAFADCLSLEKVLVIPTAVPPHKSSAFLAEDEDRLNMCALAFGDDPRFEVSDMEIMRGGKSYTVDTLISIKNDRPDARLYLLVGSDMLQSFKKWYRWRDILSLCTVCAAARRDSDPLCADFDFVRIEFDPVDISSTQIREMIKQNSGVDIYLSEKVNAYIKERGLYIE